MLRRGACSALAAVVLASLELTAFATRQVLDSGCNVVAATGCTSNCTPCGNGNGESSTKSALEETSEFQSQEVKDELIYSGEPKSRTSERSVAVALVFLALFNFGFCCCCWCCCRALDSLGNSAESSSVINPFRRVPLRSLFEDQLRSTTPDGVSLPRHTAPVAVQPLAPEDAPVSPSRKPPASVVIVQPGGGLEIGVEDGVYKDRPNEEEV